MNQTILAVLCILGIFFIWVIICIARDSNRYVIKKYQIDSDKIGSETRMLFISDLHNKEYGKHNEKLLQDIHRLHPDYILLGGDMIEAVPNSDMTPAIRFIKTLEGKYPVIYGMGNHEFRLSLYQAKYGDMYSKLCHAVKGKNLHMLDNDSIYLEKENIRISGLSIERKYYKRFKTMQLPTEYIEQLTGAYREEEYQILLAHNPDYFKAYMKYGADLTLAGHVHGGVVRLPMIGGVLSPTMRLFPKYDGGCFTENEKQMIVSRGLGMHTIPLRLWNPGELIVLDFLKNPIEERAKNR